jgi:hypothetical protein
VNPLSAPDTNAARALRGVWLLLGAALALPISLFWDFSWESTVGIDRFWSPPHVLTFVAMATAGVGAVGLMFILRRKEPPPSGVIGLGRVGAPLGGWMLAWGVMAFVTAVCFDTWWQSAYGMGAGIWHPPQILKAIAFFVTLTGIWLVAKNSTVSSMIFPLAGGLLLALIGISTITQSYPNRQHSASFYHIACATYPIVLVALAQAGRLQWSACLGAVVYLVTAGAMVWLLPLQSARPLTGPIYNPLDHLMPPPFPLLLIVPALAIDLLMRKFRWPEWRGVSWLQAGALGVAFFFLFLIAQWAFAGFLLSPAADNWFFAGGGRHWPFFLKISPPARVSFWESGPDVMTGANALQALGLSMLAARLGLWLGAWMKRVT